MNLTRLQDTVSPYSPPEVRANITTLTDTNTLIGDIAA